MKETIETISKWHAETFKDSSFAGQLRKYAEELDEFTEAVDTGVDPLSELADMVIVSAGVMRFDESVGRTLLESTYITASEYGFDMTELWEAVGTKMSRNRRRIWNKTGDGRYHHEKGIED